MLRAKQWTCSKTFLWFLVSIWLYDKRLATWVAPPSKRPAVDDVGVSMCIRLDRTILSVRHIYGETFISISRARTPPFGYFLIRATDSRLTCRSSALSTGQSERLNKRHTNSNLNKKYTFLFTSYQYWLKIMTHIMCATLLSFSRLKLQICTFRRNYTLRHVSPFFPANCPAIIYPVEWMDFQIPTWIDTKVRTRPLQNPYCWSAAKEMKRKIGEDYFVFGLELSQMGNRVRNRSLTRVRKSRWIGASTIITPIMMINGLIKYAV